MMNVPHHRLAPSSWFRLPRRTARLRLSALYGGLFLFSGAALVAATYLLFERATNVKAPHVPKLPKDAIRILLGSGPLAKTLPSLQTVKRLLTTPGSSVAGPGGAAARDLKIRLGQDEHQLATAVTQLTQAIHQVAQAGAVEAAQRAADSHQLLVTSGIALAIVTVLAVLAGWLVSGRMLRPIRTITRTAQRISSSNLHERLALSGPEDELKELGDTLDDLFGRLDASFEAQRRFVANASHELRTPLTVERTLLQVALDNPDTTNASWRTTAQEVLAYSEEQTRLIEALLTLARSESGVDGYETLDLATIVGAAIVGIQLEADRLGVRIDAQTSPSRIEGDPLLVERLVANLLNNAVRHNVPGGDVQVTTEMKDDRAVLLVSNTGSIIPPTEVDRLFQPFQRLDPRRAHHKDGHGLGLSIVRAIVTAHQATLSARPLPGGGLAVSVVFALQDKMRSDEADPPNTVGEGTDLEIATS
jgi:signal transduction histidine kinase